MMDKYAVVTEREHVKIAGQSGRCCPDCNNPNVNYTGLTPHCPRCGTRPWEQRPHGQSKKEGPR